METALQMVKARLGLTSPVRDEYLTAIVEGTVSELEEVQGLSLDLDSPHHLMFVVDLATWRYQNRDVSGVMPRYLQFRLHNLVVHSLGQKGDDDDI